MSIMEFDFKRALEAVAGGKALGPHPSFMGNDPVSVYSPGASRQDAKISQREASRHMQAYGGDQAIDWVMDSVRLYADAISTADWHLEKPDGTKLYEDKTKGTPPDHEKGPQELYDLLKNPNPFMLYEELLDLLVTDLLLVGNGYWFKWRNSSEGRPLALYRMAPAYVNVIPGQYGPKRYEYQPPGVKEPMEVATRNVVHFKLPNPHNIYYGMGIIQGGGRAFDLELAITDTMASYYENKAEPSVIVQSERRVPRDVFNKLRAQLRARMSGSNRAGEMLLLEAGLKASTLSRSAQDAMFEQLSKMSRDRVYAKFRTSPMLFGLVDEAAGGNKISDARREFDNYTLIPFVTKLQRKITQDLVAAWGLKYVVDYYSQLPADEQSKINGEIAGLPGVKVREIRRLYSRFGIEESTGDPELDEMLLNVPGGQLGPDGQPVDPSQGGFPDRPLPTEPGRPPNGSNTRAFPKGAQVQKPTLPAGKALSFTEMETVMEVMAAAEGKAVRKDLTANARTTSRPADPSADSRTANIDSTAAAIQADLAEAAHVLERALLDHAEGKAFKANDVAKKIRTSAAWNTFKEMVTKALEDAAKRSIAAAAVDSGRQAEIDIDAVSKSVVHRPEGVRSIVKTLRDRITGRVQNEAKKDQPLQAVVQAAVQETLREWTTGQAHTIAISEAVEAYNEGTLTVLEESGVTEVYVHEEEDAPDEPCVAARGQTWSIETARKNRKEHPNCRRAFLPLNELG